MSNKIHPNDRNNTITEKISTELNSAVDAFKAGAPVLIHDSGDRENEVDLMYPATSVTPSDVADLRNHAGGLICVALANEVSEAFELPFLSDVIEHPATESDHLGYDERSSFSLSVNHRETYTGITDKDRSQTISALGDAARNPGAIDFESAFRSPGHVPLLRAAPDLLVDRQGHTELGVALAKRADLPPAVVVCEMLDDTTGQALRPSDARQYAHEHGLPYVEGRKLLTAL